MSRTRRDRIALKRSRAALERLLAHPLLAEALVDTEAERAARSVDAQFPVIARFLRGARSAEN